MIFSHVKPVKELFLLLALLRIKICVKWDKIEAGFFWQFLAFNKSNQFLLHLGFQTELQVLQQKVQQAKPSNSPRADPHRRAAVQVWRMWKSFHTEAIP